MMRPEVRGRWRDESYLLTSEEHQAVAFVLLAHVNLDDGANGRLKVVSLWFGGVEDLHRVCSTGNGQQGAAVEVNLELACIQCGAHDNHLKKHVQSNDICSKDIDCEDRSVGVTQPH